MIIQRNPASPRLLGVRSMVRDDLQALRTKSAAARLQRLKDSHHNVARLLASGMSNNEVAAKTGYAASRISILRHDPAMMELIAHYRSTVDAAWAEEQSGIQASILSATAKSWRQINDRLDDEEDPVPLKQLIAIADSGADRSGYMKRSAQLNVNIDFAAKLEAAIARSKRIES